MKFANPFDCEFWVMPDPLTSKTEMQLPWLTTQFVMGILLQYRCQHSSYADSGAGMALVDVLSPEGEESVRWGHCELSDLADFIAGEIAERSPRETKCDWEAVARGRGKLLDKIYEQIEGLVHDESSAQKSSCESSGKIPKEPQ